ncbi:MAG TPA: AAA family ATPase, partial [Streptosporangiaceae bacterium]
MSEIRIPDLSLLVLIGVSGSGKSSFAARHFRPTEVISSDFCRALVSGDSNDQSATGDAFDVLNFIAGKRLAAGRLTVIDATSVQPESRKPLLALAREHHVPAVALVLNVSPSVCAARNQGRADRNLGRGVLQRQHDQLRRSLRGLRGEGFLRVFVLSGPDEAGTAVIVREPLWNDRRSDHGPFDIVGDVHGCFGELVSLLGRLGYEVSEDRRSARHPDGRRVIFLGDLVDRGPASPAVLRLAMGMARDGTAICLPGNHEVKLVRALRGQRVSTGHGLAETLGQLAAEPPEFAAEAAEFLAKLVAHFVFDDGRLVVAHAGLPAAMHGRASAAVRAFALYGDTSGESDEFGLPVRYPWAGEYRGKAIVVYGHTPVPEPVWLNRTICIDTGCVFGGRLTALRYPERELVSVPARTVYYQPARPLHTARGNATVTRVAGADGDEPVPRNKHAAPAERVPGPEWPAPAGRAATDPGELDLADVAGKRVVATRLTGGSVTIRAENAPTAIEALSRFAIDPRWLVYLPPTMAPAATSRSDGFLEHPEEALAAYLHAGISRVICEEKHMGSRAVVIACRDETVARDRFGTADVPGVIYTRTGRPFFPPDRDRPSGLERDLLARVTAALTAAGLWDELRTGWLILDCELLPWSVKAYELIRDVYAAAGAAARAALSAAERLLGQAAAREVPLDGLPATYSERMLRATLFTDAYRRYCWPVHGVDDL